MPAGGTPCSEGQPGLSFFPPVFLINRVMLSEMSSGGLCPKHLWMCLNKCLILKLLSIKSRDLLSCSALLKIRLLLLAPT